MRHADRSGVPATTSRLLAVVVALVVLGAAAWWTVDLVRPSGRTGDSGTVTGTLTMAPAIVQPGNTPARADKAAASIEARFTPASPGALVLLEQRTPQGWRPIDSAHQGARGVARLTAPSEGEDEDAVFRATALEVDGSRGASTNTLSPRDWTLVFDDEFDGTAMDPTRWAPRQLDFYNEAGSRVCSKSDERAISVADGVLRLQVMEDPDRTWESCYTDHGTFDYYLNGHVATEGTYGFRYGVAAARVKFPQGRGQHGAFWLQRQAEPIPGNPAQGGAEIDAVEFFGDGYPGGGLASFVYYLKADGENEKVGGVWPAATKQLPPGDAWWRSFHVFSVEWTPEEYVFRVDGRQVFRTSEGVSGVEQFLILSLLSSDWELPRLDETTLPSTMEVDWVRVWQRASPDE